MELSEFIYKRRSVKRIIETLPSKHQKKITKFINELEDEVIRLSRPTKATFEKEGIIEITPLKSHFTDNWKYDRDELELNVVNHLKKLDTEVGERPNMRKIYCIGDLQWMETTYPNLYKKQMQNAYNRMSVKESWHLKKQNQMNGIEFNFNN
jgi:mRNA-degrading endonuclease RelE of RelBE toxin-antitoxin system